MESVPIDIAADLDALEVRKAALRALADEIADALDALPPPENWLEADRTARAIMVADKATTRLNPSLRRHPAARLRLRQSADRLMDGAKDLPRPADGYEGERAARYLCNAERMVSQLYSPSKAQWEEDNLSPEDEPETAEDYAGILIERITHILRATARAGQRPFDDESQALEHGVPGTPYFASPDDTDPPEPIPDWITNSKMIEAITAIHANGHKVRYTPRPP